MAMGYILKLWRIRNDALVDQMLDPQQSVEMAWAYLDLQP
jgi:hypothetical protein